MKISVVVPAFNEERLLPGSLSSIRAAMEGFARLGWESELIVCDNNSTDRTAQIAKRAGAGVVFEPVNQIGPARAAKHRDSSPQSPAHQRPQAAALRPGRVVLVLAEDHRVARAHAAKPAGLLRLVRRPALTASGRAVPAPSYVCVCAFRCALDFLPGAAGGI